MRNRIEYDEVLSELGGNSFMTKGGLVIEGNCRVGDKVPLIFDRKSRRYLPMYGKKAESTFMLPEEVPVEGKAIRTTGHMTAVVYDKKQKKIFVEIQDVDRFYIDVSQTVDIKEPWYLAVLEDNPTVGALLFKTGSDIMSNPYVKSFLVLKFKLTTLDLGGDVVTYGFPVKQWKKYNFEYQVSDPQEAQISTVALPLPPVQMGHPINAQKGEFTVSYEGSVSGGGFYSSWGTTWYYTEKRGPVPWNYHWEDSAEGNGEHSA